MEITFKSMDYVVTTSTERQIASFWLFSDAIAFMKIAEWEGGCKLYDVTNAKWVEV